jgi:hypothetical protein
MNKVAVVVLATAIGMSSVALASTNVVGNQCQGNSCGVQGGNGGNGGQGGDGGNGGDGFGFGGSALSKSESEATSTSAAIQGQLQGQAQGQGISAFNGNTTTVEAPDVKALGEQLKNHAETAGDVRSNSNPVTSPCGDSTGLSGQVGVAGGGLATVSETCRAFRIQMLETVNPDATSTKLAKVTHFVGWLPRTILHVASFGVLN